MSRRRTLLWGGLVLALLLGMIWASATVLRVDPGELSPGPDPSSTARPAYPVQTELAETSPDASDLSHRAGLTPADEIAGRLNRAQQNSPRVGAEVIAHSHGGREIVMATVTAPETAAQSAEQERWRELIHTDPAAAAADSALAQGYKVPIFINANIHGDEWEGTDAVLDLIEHLGVSTEPEVESLLRSTRVHLVVSANPDGRVAGTRANDAGFDLNRDLLTGSQPETLGLRSAIAATQPVALIDLHGYVNGTLIEPATAPHGEALEYDLFLSRAYPLALAIEQRVLALGELDGVSDPQIPLRDWDQGWDDWPPIFTPQYALFHGTVGLTVELPLPINRGTASMGAAELSRRAEVNMGVARTVLDATLAQVQQERGAFLQAQIETFRRGVAGEPQREVGPELMPDLLPDLGPDDVFLTDFPRAYLIPSGAGQRSEPAAARLVDHLIDQGVQVQHTHRPITLAEGSWPNGGHLVDLHQARRGLAHTTLGPGSDISDRADTMYDIAAWSPGLLGGATVVALDDLPADPGLVRTQSWEGPTCPVTEGPWTLPLNDPAEFTLLHALAEAGADLRIDGADQVWVGASADLASMAGVGDAGLCLVPATSEAVGAAVNPPVVGSLARPEENWALGLMGFEVRALSAGQTSDPSTWEDLDVLYLSGPAAASLPEPGRQLLADFVDDGGGVVARGESAARVVIALGLLEAEVTRGPGEANGIVQVWNDPGDAALAAGMPQTTFVYAPTWFTDLGADVRVDQQLTDDPLISGHWRDRAGDGPDAAAGAALMVHSEAQGRVVAHGGEPLFRAHPQGQFALIGRSLLWAGRGD